MILSEEEDIYVADDQVDMINTPAVAAACVIKNYTAQEPDEISIEVGDIISVIDIPESQTESAWWRGKRAFQVGYFPSECVEIICDNQIQNAFMFSSGNNALYSPAINTFKRNSNGSNKSNSIREKRKSSAFSPVLLLNRTLRKQNKMDCVKKVFGCDLIKHLNDTSELIPGILKLCAEFIERAGIVPGIYRLSGVKSTIQKLRQSIDEGKSIDLDDDAILNDVHCVASLLKMYFRELPNPLLTYQLYDKFLKALQPNIGMDDCPSENSVPDSVKLRNLRDVIHQLPLPHFRSLEHLMRHLSSISSNSIKTGMTSKNLAIVWAPNLLRSRNIEQQAGIEALHYIGVQAIVTEYLIKYVNVLFDQDYLPTSSPPRLPPTSRSNIPSSISKRLITLEEARGRCGHVIDSDFDAANNEFEVPSSKCFTGDNRKYHTVIDHRPKGIYRDLRKVSFQVNYIHTPS